MDHTPEWLKKLQEESWQAETLVSGGAILVLANIYSGFGDVQAAVVYGTKLGVGAGTAAFTYFTFFFFILIGGFLIHLVLRGYWIALVGLNYVYPDGVNQERLNFTGRFATFIKGNSNTPFTIALDKGCSQVFALTFFLIFSLTGMFLFFGCAFFLARMLVWMDAPELLRQSLMGIFAAAGILHFIDFFTFGWMKRIRWLSKIYYPIYYAMSRITLSLFYRRYYYTIVSNIGGLKILSGIAVLVAVLAMLIMSDAAAIPGISTNNSGREEQYLLVKEPVVRGGLLEFSILHIPALEGSLLEEYNNEHKDRPIEDLADLSPKESFALLTSLYEIRIDSMVVPHVDWFVEDEYLLGFNLMRLNTAIDVQGLDNGTHQLFVRIRSADENLQVKGLDYYANAYFLVRK